MGALRDWFGYPGQRHDIHHSAGMMEPMNLQEVDDEKTLEKVIVESEKDVSFNGLKATSFDKGLDWLVYIVGTKAAFLVMWIIVLIWVIVGIVCGATQDWQVVLQDGQSIQTYIWDTFLMRQQLIQSYEQNLIWSEFRSRTSTFRRLLPLALAQKAKEDIPVIKVGKQTAEEVVGKNLPEQGWFDHLSTFISVWMGSAPAIIIYWVGIFVWVGCGALYADALNTPPFTGEYTGSNPKYQKWSNLWQLCINTATGLILLISSVCLQNVRARHDLFLTKVLHDVLHMDHEVEAKLRFLTKDTEPNPSILIPTEKRTKAVYLIDFYGDIIGTGVGVIIICVVIIIWIIIGHPMSWSTNWWLIIGTYTGLIGFLDGFVVRNVYYRTTKFDDATQAITIEEEKQLFEEIGLPYPEIVLEEDNSIVRRISEYVNDACSSTWGVGFSIFVILLLIIVASAMKWSETGQLICNTPTMIIEGFFLLILMQAHNWSDEELRVEVAALSMRRQILNEFVKKL